MRDDAAAARRAARGVRGVLDGRRGRAASDARDDAVHDRGRAREHAPAPVLRERRAAMREISRVAVRVRVDAAGAGVPDAEELGRGDGGGRWRS